MSRIYHHWEKWECYKSGFYETAPPIGYTSDEARNAYFLFLSDIPRFKMAVDRVIEEWPNSCDQFLTNESINKIAWLGQASMCIETSVPSVFRGGFKMLSASQQRAANAAAAEALEKWRMIKAYDSDKNTDKAVHRGMETARLF